MQRSEGSESKRELKKIMGKAQKRKDENMKKMKRFFALFLAMAMVLGMSMTTMAAPGDATAKITINVKEATGATIKYAKIAEAAPTTPLGWSLVEGVTLSNGVTIEQLANVAQGKSNEEAVKDAADGTINSNELVAKAIKDIILDTTLDAGVTEITGVTPGLYVIEVQKNGWTFTRMLAYVAWNNDNTAAVPVTSVTAKGAPDQVAKEISAEGNTSVSEGDVVPFEVTATYPYLAQTIENPRFEIKDEVKGGEIQGTPVVTIDGANASANDVTVTVAEDKKSFTAVFNYKIANASDAVVIRYNVEVKLGANETQLENNVSSTISSLTGGDPTTTDAKVISPTVDATVKKTAETADGTALAGAKFALYVESNEGATAYKNAEDAIIVLEEGASVPAGMTALKYVDEQITGDGEDGTTLGIATFTKLDADKKYWVVETEAPTGYSLNTRAEALTGAVITPGTAEPKEIDGKTVMVTENKKESDFTQVTIVDTTLSALPSTGGIGTTIFTVGGCAIMILAAGMFFVSRRRAAK